jgi:hypothetical protein
MPRTYCHRDVDDILSGYTFNDRVRSAELDGLKGSTPVNDRPVKAVTRREQCTVRSAVNCYTGGFQHIIRQVHKVSAHYQRLVTTGHYAEL